MWSSVGELQTLAKGAARVTALIGRSEEQRVYKDGKTSPRSTARSS
jgi:hypothetical protein